MPILEDVLGSRINIQILRYLTAIRGGLSGNEIATRLGLQQSSVRQALERLVAARVITRRDVGRSAAYELDRDLAFSNIVLEPLFQSEARLRDDLIDALSRACGELGNALSSVVLFGSLARADRDFRDVDLLLVASKAKHKARLHDDIAERFEPVLRHYGVPVSAVVVTEAELRSPKFASVIDAVRREGIVLAGRRRAYSETYGYEQRWGCEVVARKHPSSTVARSLAVKYFDKAARFKTDAERMSALANEFSGNGVAVLCVHAAIAYGDAISILAAGRNLKAVIIVRQHPSCRLSSRSELQKTKLRCVRFRRFSIEKTWSRIWITSWTRRRQLLCWGVSGHFAWAER